MDPNITDPEPANLESATIIEPQDGLSLPETPFQENIPTNDVTAVLSLEKDFSLSKISHFPAKDTVPIQWNHKCIGCDCSH